MHKYNQEWGGLESSKFGYAERVHFEPRDMLKTLQGSDFPPTGRKHFEPTYGEVMEERIGLQVFPTIHNIQTKLDEPKSLSKLAYVAPPKKIFNKLNGVSPSFFKPSRIKSLVRPQTFNGIRSTRQEVMAVRKDLTTAGSLTARTNQSSIRVVKLDWKQKEKIQARQSEINEVENLNHWLPLTTRPQSSRFGSGFETARLISSRTQLATAGGNRSLSQRKL